MKRSNVDDSIVLWNTIAAITNPLADYIFVIQVKIWIQTRTAVRVADGEPPMIN